MTIPDEIKAAYLAIAAGSKPRERDAARAIRWAVAGWLEAEFWREHDDDVDIASSNPCCDACVAIANDVLVVDSRHHWVYADWLAEAQKSLEGI